MDSNLRERRKQLRLTQDEVADFLGVSRYTVMKWEDRPEQMPLGQYEKLVNEFKRLEEMKYGLDTN